MESVGGSILFLKKKNKKKKTRFAFFFLISLASPWLSPRIKSLFKKTPVLPVYLPKLILPLKLYNTETIMLHIRP